MGFHAALYTLAVVGAVASQLFFDSTETILKIATLDSFSDRITLVLSGLSVGLTVVIGIFAINRGLASIRIETHDWLQKVDQRLRRRQQAAFVVMVVTTAVVFEFTRAETTAIGVEWTVATAVTLFALYHYFTYQVAVPGRKTRHPDPAEHEQIKQWYDELGTLPSNIIIFNDEKRPANAIAGGRGSTRWVWIHERVLSEHNDTLGIALTQAEIKRRAQYWPLTVCKLLFGWWLFITSLAILLTLSGLNPPSTPAILALVVFGVLFGVVTWTLRRVSYRADDTVVTMFDAKQVVDAYQRIGPLNFVAELPAWLELLDGEPGTSNRIQRLCDHHSIEPPAVSTSSDSRSATVDPHSMVPPVIWLAVIGICTLIWPVLLMDFVFQWWLLDPGPTVMLTAVLTLALPLAIHSDAQQTRPDSQWPAYPKLVALLSAVWFLNVAVGCWYLWKRRGVSSDPETTPPSG